MKNLTNKLISFILMIAMVFTTTVPAFASHQVRYDENISIEQVQTAQETYNNLTPEARVIFEQAISSDQELLEFHQKYVDPNFNPLPTTYSQTATIANQLALLGLPSAVTYSLNAMAASMVAAVADGPLPIGDILLAASVAAVATTVALNWDEVQPLWDDIVDIFTDAFSDSVSAVISAFDTIFGDSTLEYYQENYPVTYDASKKRVKVGDSYYTCSTKAEVKEETASRNSYYVAALANGLVYVTPYTVSEEIATAITAANLKNVGVMAYNESTARKIANNLGGVLRHEIDSGKENTEGYWAHFHSKSAPKSHIWYFSKAKP